MTVQSEQFGNLTLRERVRERDLHFSSSDFRRVVSGENHTESPQAHVVSWNKGDKVTPKKGMARSMDGAVTISPKQVVTVKEVKGDFILIEECFGVFSALDFTLVRSAGSAESLPPRPQQPTTPRGTPIATPTRGLPQGHSGQEEPQPGRRRALKRKFEQELKQKLEWRNEYLCFAGTDTRIPNSPYKPTSP